MSLNKIFLAIIALLLLITILPTMASDTESCTLKDTVAHPWVYTKLGNSGLAYEINGNGDPSKKWYLKEDIPPGTDFYVDIMFYNISGDILTVDKLTVNYSNGLKPYFKENEKGTKIVTTEGYTYKNTRDCGGWNDNYTGFVAPHFYIDKSISSGSIERVSFTFVINGKKYVTNPLHIIVK